MISSSGILPLQVVPKEKWTEEYYRECVSAIVSSWGNYNAGSYDAYAIYREMWDCYNAFLMRSDGGSTQWMREPMPGMVANAQYMQGGLVYSIVNSHVGAITEFLNSIEVSASSLSKDVLNDYSMHENALLFQYNYSELAKVLQGLGVQFRNQLPPNVAEQGEKYVREFASKTFTNENIKNAVYISQSALEQNKYKEIFIRQALHLLISGVAALYIDNDNSDLIPRWKEIPSMFLIKDRRVDSNSGAYDEYVGYLEYKPVSEVVAEYKLSEDEARWLVSQATSTQNQIYWNRFFGFPIYATTNSGGMIGIITAYWDSYKDSGYTASTDNYGNAHVKKTDKKGIPLPTVRTAKLIGGKILRAAGECTNLTINSLTGKPHKPIVTFTPQMLFGQTKSMVARIKDYEELRQSYWSKLQQHVAEDYGMVLKFDTSQASQGTPDAYTVYQKMAELRIIEHNSSEREGQKGDGIDILDKGLSPSTSLYFNLLVVTENEMRTITSTSLPSQGMQQSIIGKGVMDTTIAANTRGNAQWMQGLYDHFNNIVQITADQTRMNLAAFEGKEIPLHIGMGNIKMIKATQDLTYSKMQIKVRMDDATSREKKNYLMQLGNAWATNNVVSPLASLELIDEPTYQGMKEILERDFKEMQQIKQQQAQAQMEHEQMLEDKKAQKDLGVAKTYSEATLQNTAMKEGAEDARLIQKEGIEQ